MLKLISLLVVLCCSVGMLAQPQIQMLAERPGISIRGLSVVNDSIFWLSGSKGTVGRSIDGGVHVEWMKVKGFDSSDFRDIEAFNAKEAIIMGIGSPAYILKTTDAGKTWFKVFEHFDKAMFLDAMHFFDQQIGMVIGDPIQGRFFMAKTFDAGNHWKILDSVACPEAQQGEACFASSGSNLKLLDANQFCFVSGGNRSRFFKGSKSIDIPILQGLESTGANSLSIHDDKKHMVIVGGDFNHKLATDSVCILSDNGGQSWILSKTQPSGYRSCVIAIGLNELICCGLNGVDYSLDGGMHWINISREGFHTCVKALNGKLVILAGANGRIAKLIYK